MERSFFELWAAAVPIDAEFLREDGDGFKMLCARRDGARPVKIEIWTDDKGRLYCLEAAI